MRFSVWKGWDQKKFCKKLLKAGYVDVIASDSHGIEKRACHLGRCREVLSKKMGEEYAQRLLCDNPAKIIADALQ